MNKKRTIKDAVDIELTKRDAQDYIEDNGLLEFANAPYVVIEPNCACNKGLDDSTAVLKCPVCGTPGAERL